MQIWATADSLLRNYRIEHGSREVQISIDWHHVIESCRLYGSVMEELEGFLARNLPLPEEVLRKFPDRTEIAIEVQSTESKTPIGYFHPALYVENRLADVFLMMNIAEPGCCDFYLASLLEQRTDARGFNNTNISLSSTLFEIAQVHTLDGQWPYASSINLETVVRWFEKIRTGVRQLPQNQFEKVLFSILHLAYSDASSTSIIWLFYALETLLDTKPGENRAALERRLIVLLEPSEKERRKLKTKLRELYDYRSSVVHGGLSVASPLQLESLDEDFENEYRRMLELVEYGFALLLACLQKVALNGWTELRFKDVMEGQ
jgi:hypothetical protein